MRTHLSDYVCHVQGLVRPIKYGSNIMFALAWGLLAYLRRENPSKESINICTHMYTHYMHTHMAQSEGEEEEKKNEQ